MRLPLSDWEVKLRQRCCLPVKEPFLGGQEMRRSSKLSATRPLASGNSS